MSLMHTLPPDMRTVLQQQLLPGEHVAWVGRPASGRAARNSFAIWLFAIPWSAISFTFFGVAVSALAHSVMGWPGGPKNGGDDMSLGMAIFFLLFSLPFVLIGMGLFLSPFLAGREYKRTLYALTDQRALTLIFKRVLEVKSITGPRMGQLTKRVYRDGSGSLIIQTGAHRDSDGDKTIDKFEILHVPNVAEAERHLNALLTTRP